MKPLTHVISVAALLGLASMGQAQIPDVLNALDAGGRSLGMGGALEGTDPGTQSTYYNPAGLGFLKKMQVGVTWRNLPTSITDISGSRSAPTYSTSGKSGSHAFTDLGIAIPIKDIFKKGQGTLGFSYTIGGYVNDRGFGPNAGLPDGGLTINDYTLDRSAETDFYTLGYGIADHAESFSFGIGLTYADVKVGYQENGQAIDSSGNSAYFPASNINYDAHGFGAIAGIQVVPPSNPNFSIGASVRTPIELTDTGPGGIYDRVPGRALVSASYRIDNLMHSEDFALIGAQLQYFFDGKQSIAFDENDQTVYGLGLEYDHNFGNFRVPFRIGYESLGTGNVGFGSRNLITYGVGFRPPDSSYSLDLNWAHPDTGGIDMGITAGYRFKQ